MTDEEYLIKYQEEYDLLNETEKKYVLSCKHKYDSLTNKEVKETIKIMESFKDWSEDLIVSNVDENIAIEN